MALSRAPSQIWSLVVDQPISQDATFPIQDPSYRVDRAYIDSQIRGCEMHLFQSVLSGLTATWRTLDGSSAPAQVGDVVCSAGSSVQTVARALYASVSAAGMALGVLVSAGGPGSTVRLATQGLIPPSVTGLPTSGNHPYARVNTSTARVETVTSIATSDFFLGTVDAGGNLTLSAAVPLSSGGGGTVTWQYNGTVIAAATTVNFVGAGVSVATVGGTPTVTIPGASSTFSPWVSVSGSFTPTTERKISLDPSVSSPFTFPTPLGDGDSIEVQADGTKTFNVAPTLTSTGGDNFGDPEGWGAAVTSSQISTPGKTWKWTYRLSDTTWLLEF